MNFAKKIKEMLIKQKKLNIKELRDNIELYGEKINSFIDRNPWFSFEETQQGILENDIIASFFCKDPLKQNLKERACSELLGEKTLPQSGCHAIRFTRDKLTSKAADFHINDWYVSQKFTNGEGGAQNLALQDVEVFLYCADKGAAIVDGTFWTAKRIKSLKEKFPNAIITSMDEIANKGKEVIFT